MAFPLEQRVAGGYSFRQKTAYSAHHVGQDYEAKLARGEAPFDGTVLRRFTGREGGMTIWFKPDGDDVVIRFLHLDAFMTPSEHVKKGTPLFVTGNTGMGVDSRGNIVDDTIYHLHLDISKNAVDINDIDNFIDPEQYDWDFDIPSDTLTDMEKKAYEDKIRELNTELGTTTRQRDGNLERTEDALGISKTGDIEKVLEAIGGITTENGRVTEQRDKCLRGENSKLSAIIQIIFG